MGIWQGQTIQQRRGAPKSKVEDPASGVETLKSISDRAAEWWGEVEEFVSQCRLRPATCDESTTKRDTHVLAVSHGYWISVLVRGLVDSGRAKIVGGTPSAGKIGNTSITRVVFDDDRSRDPVLVKFGDMEHLLVGEGVAGNADAEAAEDGKK